MRRSSAVAAIVLLAALGLKAAGQAPASAPAADLPFKVQVVADFDSPWAMTFLPDGRMLITEKAGTLHLISADGQQRKTVSGIPQVSSEGQGGLMDVVLHPGFAKNKKYKVNWTPVISPAGLMVYSGKLWPQWKGDLFIGALSSKALVRVDIDGTNARKGDQWSMGERIREPAEGPDGAIWLLEDGQGNGQGRLLKLTPK